MNAPKPKLDIDTTRERLLVLGCSHAAEHLDQVLSDAVRQEIAPHAFLNLLLETELSGREDDGPLLRAGLPGQLVGTCGAVLAVLRPALAPLANGLGRDAVAPGPHARGRGGAGDLGPDGGRGAGVRVDGEHQRLPG